jgi:hypothetical protein
MPKTKTAMKEPAQTQIAPRQMIQIAVLPRVLNKLGQYGIKPLLRFLFPSKPLRRFFLAIGGK